MPKLPEKKVGIVACSGEELAEGTVTRLAALRVLENLRPADTVTICLPLFLAGGEGDRAFARFYPTIAVDGCEQRCAARATEKYSGVPAASIVVTDVVMPGMGGLDICSRIRSHAALDELKIIILTGYPGGGNPEKSLLYGADLFLTKPQEVATLRAHVRDLLED